MLESRSSGVSGSSRPLVLSGVSFAATVCDTLFLWGNSLLYR